MSTSKSPGGRSTPSVSGSHWTISSAPVALRDRAQRLEVLDRAEEVRLAEEDRGDVVADARARSRRAPSVERDLLDRRAPAGGRSSRASRASAGAGPRRRGSACLLGVRCARASRRRRRRSGPRRRDALETGRPVSSEIAVWYSNITCSPPWRDLGLVGRVRRQELRALQDRVDQRRDVVVVHPGAEERRSRPRRTRCGRRGRAGSA